MWIKCTLLDGNPFLINLDHVAAIMPADDNTAIIFSSGESETVSEPFDTITERVATSG